MSDSRTADLSFSTARFREEREADWEEFDRLLTRLEKGSARALTDEELLRLPALYRATLSQLINKQHLPVKQHHTEGKVSLLVNQQLPMLSTYFQSLTNAWLRTAYGHQQLPREDLQQLCGLYATHFEQKAHA